MTTGSDDMTAATGARARNVAGDGRMQGERR